MSSDPIEVEVRRQTAILRINRPHVHNSINLEAMECLESKMRQLRRQSQIRAIILTAAGNESFCSGGDLNYFAQLKTRRAGLAMSRRMQSILSRLCETQWVVIAAINGQALGGGCEILTACHFRIAVPRATFQFRQGPNGLITGWGGGIRLFQLAGQSQALRLLLKAEAINAKEALRIGFIDQIVSSRQLMNAALKLADTINQYPLLAIRSFLEVARLARLANHQQAVRRETELFGDCWIGKDFRKMLSRFIQNKQK